MTAGELATVRGTEAISIDPDPWGDKYIDAVVAAKRIRTALTKRPGRPWSVRVAGGSYTSGVEIATPRARRVGNHFLTGDDIETLCELLDLDTRCWALKRTASTIRSEATVSGSRGSAAAASTTPGSRSAGGGSDGRRAWRVVGVAGVCGVMSGLSGPVDGGGSDLRSQWRRPSRCYSG